MRAGKFNLSAPSRNQSPHELGRYLRRTGQLVEGRVEGRTQDEHGDAVGGDSHDGAADAAMEAEPPPPARALSGASMSVAAEEEEEEEELPLIRSRVSVTGFKGVYRSRNGFKVQIKADTIAKFNTVREVTAIEGRRPQKRMPP